LLNGQRELSTNDKSQQVNSKRQQALASNRQSTRSNRSIQLAVNKLSQLLQRGDSKKRLLLVQEWLNKSYSKGRSKSLWKVLQIQQEWLLRTQEWHIKSDYYSSLGSWRR
jgi:hypothetical protein